MITYNIMKKLSLLLVALFSIFVNVVNAQTIEDIEKMRARCEKISELLEKEIEATDNVAVDAFVVEMYRVSASSVEITSQLDEIYTALQSGTTPSLSSLNTLSGQIEDQAELSANVAKMATLAVQSAKAEKNPIKTGKLVLKMAPATKLSPLVAAESVDQVKFIAQLLNSIKNNL